jgi:hypothetical protein
MVSARGQSALEYMMTYGWAVLIVLIIGVVVWQMGLLDLSQNINPDKRGFSQVAPLDWRLAEDGTFTVVVQNNAGTMLDITAAGANVIIGGGTCTLATGIPINDFRPAATRQLDFNTCAVTRKNGEYYRVNLSITYLNKGSGLVHVSNGVMWGPVG